VERRSFLAGLGLVTAGAVVGTGVGAASEPALATQSPSARTARPSGQKVALQARVSFRAAPSEKLVALTIDDGPTSEWTPQVLAVLRRRNALGTFFVVGKRAAANPAIVALAAAAGHQIGNHTWAHNDLTHQDEAHARSSLERAHETITKLTTLPPLVCRPPYGRIDSVGLAVCASLGYDIALWSDHITGSNAAGDVDTTLREASAGSIVLAHDGGPEPNTTFVAQLDRLIGSMQDAGFAFTTVSRLLAAPPAAAPTAAPAATASTAAST
jgi:peptidoglycan/xylan/chitin deacetylase (PgdA/CDA1 family)